LPPTTKHGGTQFRPSSARGKRLKTITELKWSVPYGNMSFLVIVVLQNMNVIYPIVWFVDGRCVDKGPRSN
jgi:hypothetical protein